MNYFWQSELAYSQDKRAAREYSEPPFIRRKAFIDDKVVQYDRMDTDFKRGEDFYARTFPDLKFLGTGEIYEINGAKQGRFRNMNVNEKYCVTIGDVYGVPFAALSAPQGYEFTGEFRPARPGDTILPVGTLLPCEIGPNAKVDHPRLILRALPTVESVYAGQALEQLKENAKTAKCLEGGNLKFEWTGEFRKVQHGEYFLCGWDGLDIMLNNFGPTTAPRLIMRKCPTIKEIYGKELSELTPPKGYEFGEFRKLQAGDDWLSALDLRALTKHCSNVGEYRLTLKKVTTVEGIYGAPLDKLTPPIGYRFTGEFRRAKAGETVMLTNDLGAFEYISDERGEHPRLILEKLPANPTIKDVYGTDTPALPKGWRMKEFRQIKEGEDIYYLGSRNFGPISDRPLHARNEDWYAGGWMDGWRIVLEKDLSTLTYTETVTVKDVYGNIPRIPLEYEVIGFRPPKAGDVFMNSYGAIETAQHNWSALCVPRLILSPLGPR